MSTRTSADVVVIGGGVVGTAVTYFLACNHVDVLLVDKGAIAGGASGRCEGNVLLIDKMPGFDCHLTKLSQNLFRKFRKNSTTRSNGPKREACWS